MVEEPWPPFVSLSLMYHDQELLLFECKVATEDGWSGVVRADAGYELAGTARVVQRWAAAPTGVTAIELGLSSDRGGLSLRFYEADAAGHVGCDLEMTADSAQPARRLSLRLRSEPGLVDYFARHLAAVVENQEGSTTLKCVPAR